VKSTKECCDGKQVGLLQDDGSGGSGGDQPRAGQGFGSGADCAFGRFCTPPPASAPHNSLSRAPMAPSSPNNRPCSKRAWSRGKCRRVKCALRPSAVLPDITRLCGLVLGGHEVYFAKYTSKHGTEQALSAALCTEEGDEPVDGKRAEGCYRGAH
jgi:hypothetical protein